jgi:hypothetical protein
MKVENLKNYRRPFTETIPALPDPVERLARSRGAKVIRNEMGLLGLLRVLFLTWSEKRRMARVDLDPVRRKGLAEEAFIDRLLQNAAMFSATVRVVGLDRALLIHRKIMDEVAVPINNALLPSASEFKRTGDSFAAFRDYLLAFFEAERAAGLHEYHVVEDSQDVLAIDVTYCAFCEIPRCLGVAEACEPSCYADEVFFPTLLEPLGLRFVRTKTLGRGDDLCDFRYERFPVGESTDV